MVREYSLADAKAQFSEVVRKAMLGDEIVITRENQPAVKITAVKPLRRMPGTGKGVIMPRDFDAPLGDFAEYM